jgi:hypothetical protein
MDYCDVETLEAYGGFDNPTEQEKEQLARLISTASEMVDNYCGRVFGIEEDAAAVAKTFTVDNGLMELGSRTLWLQDDLCSTPTYAEGTVVVTLVPPGGPYERIVRDVDEGSWPDPTVVTGHWAYSMTPPVTIVQAVLRLAAWMFRQKETTDGDRPLLTPSGAVIMPDAMPADIAFLLGPFRKYRGAA